jgi:hypothetical protein
MNISLSKTPNWFTNSYCQLLIAVPYFSENCTDEVRYGSDGILYSLEDLFGGNNGNEPYVFVPSSTYCSRCSENVYRHKCVVFLNHETTKFHLLPNDIALTLSYDILKSGRVLCCRCTSTCNGKKGDVESICKVGNQNKNNTFSYPLESGSISWKSFPLI